MNRDDIVQYFRRDDLLDLLSHEDLNEIALHCVSYSDYVYEKLSKTIESYENEEESTTI